VIILAAAPIAIRAQAHLLANTYKQEVRVPENVIALNARRQ
jgi:hypothetical protein